MNLGTTAHLSRLLTIAALLMPVPSFGQEPWRSDGNWWLAQSKAARESHILGVMDGVRLQEALVLKSHIDREDDPDVIRRRQAESMAAPRKLLKGLNSSQIRDGLDVFYADFRNRQISLPNAMQIVIYQINAESLAVIEHLLEAMRRSRE